MKNSIYLFLFLFLVGFTSCKKKHTVHIKAVNAVTGAPYAGLPYSIKGTKTSTNGEKLVFEHNGTLDNNGEAAPNVKVNENLTLHVGVTKPNNTCYTKDINFFWDAKASQNPSFLFEYAECATWQQKVTNTNCFDTNDKIEITVSNTVNSLSTNPWVLNGCADYETVVTQVPIGTYNLQWVVTKNGVSSTFNDSFILQENEFKYHTINY